jgi:hypothetical protein
MKIALAAKTEVIMSELEYREVKETARRACQHTLRKCEASRDYWKFAAMVFFFISLYCVLDRLGCFSDLN